MDVIKAVALKADFLTKPPNGIPMLLIDPSARTLRKFRNSGYKDVSLNRELAEKLLELPVEQRASKVTASVQIILSNYASAILLRDYEMLFDPTYQLDVLKLFCDLSRHFRIAVVWCGTYHDTFLDYAEPGYSDHQSYNVDNYMLYCIR